MFMKRFRASLLALCAFAVMAPAAFASDGTQVVVTGGALSITNPEAANFPGVTLNGSDQSPTAALATFSVTDATGSGNGWHVTAQADQFTGASHNLAVGSLSMSQPTVVANGTSSPDPSVANGPYTIDNGAVEIASADVDEGMGTYDFGATTLTLSIPASAYVDTYASTVTISVVTAP